MTKETLRQRINELSKGKLHAYISNAVQDYGSQKSMGKRIKRYVGIDRAVSKIAKRGALVPANEVKTYVRSPWRRTIGTSSAAAKASGIKPLMTTPETDEPKNTYHYDPVKAIAAAKERLKFRGKRRRFYGGEETAQPSLNELMLERAKRFGIAGQIAYYRDKINEETRKPPSISEADIIQQVVGLAIKAGVRGLRRLIGGPGKIPAGQVKPIKKPSVPRSNPVQTAKPPKPLNTGPWGERPFSNSPPHIKQGTVATPSTSGSVNSSNKMSGADFRALLNKNPKLKVGAGKK